MLSLGIGTMITNTAVPGFYYYSYSIIYHKFTSTFNMISVAVSTAIVETHTDTYLHMIYVCKTVMYTTRKPPAL